MSSKAPSNEAETREAFDTRFRIVCEPPMLRAEKAALGSEYGASSFTTVEQAESLVAAMALAPGKMLLDVGSGAGWPGVFLAHTTGSIVVSVDLSVEGPRQARARMDRDGVAGFALSASATRLPLKNDLVDAVTCSDVFC